MKYTKACTRLRLHTQLLLKSGKHRRTVGIDGSFRSPRPVRYPIRRESQRGVEYSGETRAIDDSAYPPGDEAGTRSGPTLIWIARLCLPQTVHSPDRPELPDWRKAGMRSDSGGSGPRQASGECRRRIRLTKDDCWLVRVFRKSVLRCERTVW